MQGFYEIMHLIHDYSCIELEVCICISTLNSVNQWRIQDGGIWGKYPPLVEPAMLLALNLYVRPRSVYQLMPENIHILLAFSTNSPETKANQSQTSCKTITQHLRAY